MTPDEYTNQELQHDVGDGHSLYVHDWGRADAVLPTIIYLHGGPGSSVKDSNKQLFDGSRQRVIFFDQRGCGRSTPYGLLEHNTTAELVGDISRIADHLQIERFILVGGSWGSCLALAYALEHPQRVAAMVLNGVFTGSQAENDWLTNGIWATFFPDTWETYEQTVPLKYRKNPSRYHFTRGLGKDAAHAKASAYAYGNMEHTILRLDDLFSAGNYEDFDPIPAKLEMHYMQNRCFMPDRYILRNAHKLPMPVWLVQGRYDMVCPPVTAYELHSKLPNSELIWTIGGHKNEHEGWNLMRTILRQITQSASV